MSASERLDRRDLRQGGSWSRSQKLKNTSIYLVLCAALALADKLPEAVLLRAGQLLGRIALFLSPALRTRARRQLELAFTRSEARALVQQTFLQAGENLALCLLLRRPEVRALDFVDVPLLSRQTLESARSEGRGIVFVSPHHGPFELIAAAVAELGYRAAVVVRESYDPRLDPLVDQHRTLRGLQVIHRGKSTALRRMLRVLRAGRIVGFLPDMPGRARSVRARFLGAERPFALGPQRIAVRTGAALLVGTLARHGQKLRLDIRRAEGPSEPEMTQRVAEIFGRAISASPADWPWMAASACDPPEPAQSAADAVMLR